MPSDATCPGEATHSFNSGNASGNSSIGAEGNSKSNGVQPAAIVGGAVGAMVLLGLLFFLFLRRNKHRGVKFLRRDHDQKSEYILDSAPIAHSDGLKHHHQVQSTSLIHSDASSSTSPAHRKEGAVLISHSMESDVQVQQHTDAGRVMEHPPEYKDAATH